LIFQYILIRFIPIIGQSSKIYCDVVQKIMEGAFEHSHVMENASWLCDVFGPRKAKSTSFRAAAKWAKKRLEEYGLANVTLDPFEFGTGSPTPTWMSMSALSRKA
jgi:hypothetical protein